MTNQIADIKTPQLCVNCVHFDRCEWLIQCRPDSTDCDWDPSRFVRKP